MPTAEIAVLSDRLTLLSERAAEGTSIEIAEVEVRGAGRSRLVRVYIDKPGGVSHGDCQTISERLGEMLDANQDSINDALGDGYTLEVSSPGVERRLHKPRDFERAVGQKIKLTTLQPVDGRTSWTGKLERFADGFLSVETTPGNLVQIQLNQIRKANLKFEW